MKQHNRNGQCNNEQQDKNGQCKNETREQEWSVNETRE